MQYNPEFVSHHPILTDDEKIELEQLSNAYPLKSFLGDQRNFEEMMVDFVYTSAKIEGNTYDRLDTDNLLRMGITAGGKIYSDAVMLKNLRSGFEQVMTRQDNAVLDLDYTSALHGVLMNGLLEPSQIGSVRDTAVNIGASSYKPLSSRERLKTEAKFIFVEASKYDNAFEKAIYLHCNLAYLQYFKDGNKRTARMMQTASLVNDDKLPLFFNDTLIEKYKRATIEYYEKGTYAPYVAFFKENYQLNIQNFLGLENSQELKKSLMDKPIEVRPKAEYKPLATSKGLKR